MRCGECGGEFAELKKDVCGRYCASCWESMEIPCDGDCGCGFVRSDMKADGDFLFCQICVDGGWDAERCNRIDEQECNEVGVGKIWQDSDYIED